MEDKICYKTVYDFENLYQAHKKARRGKRDRKDVAAFEFDLAVQLHQIQTELKNKTYRPLPYHRFIIHDPKERNIDALQYRDRIVQHSLCDNVIEPYMERHLIYDNAAGRVGKGTHFAMNRLSRFFREYVKKYGTQGYILKFDVRKYFENIDHKILYQLCEKAFQDDKDLQRILKTIIDSFHRKEGKGLPLGNQSSSWFALYYLDGLDRVIKEKLRLKYYTRYMDDGVILHHDRDYLKYCLAVMEEYITRERKLEFNRKTQIVPMSQGVDYLGFHFYLTDTGKVIRRLRTSNKKRMKRKIKRFRHAYREGKITYDAVKRSLASYRGHLSHGHTYQLRRTIYSHLVLSKNKRDRVEIKKDKGQGKGENYD